jgi:hypothetical protein
MQNPNQSHANPQLSPTRSRPRQFPSKTSPEKDRKHPYNPWYDWIGIPVIGIIISLLGGIQFAITICLFCGIIAYLCKLNYRYTIVIVEMKKDLSQKTDMIQTLYANEKLLFELVNTLRLRITKKHEAKQGRDRNTSTKRI